MNTRRDELLARELGKIGALGGRIGGGAAGALGGSLGAGLAARFLPSEQCRKEVTVSLDAVRVLTELAFFLHREGRLADEREAGTSPYPKMSGVLGSGFFKLNPTVVHVEVIGVDDHACTLLVSGAAKEGLIRQRSAEKAVGRIVAFLESMG